MFRDPVALHNKSSFSIIQRKQESEQRKKFHGREPLYLLDCGNLYLYAHIYIKSVDGTTE